MSKVASWGALLVLIVVLVLNIIILVEMPSSSSSETSPTDAAVSSRAALVEAENIAIAHMFTSLSLFAGNLSALDAAQVAPSHGGPLRVARAFAIVHIAMADAIGAATRAFEPYTNIQFAIEPTSACAAAVAAAHDTLVALYPPFRTQIAAFTQSLFGSIAGTEAKERGALLGRRAAHLILALRANDGAAHAEPPAAQFESAEPGKWRRDPVAKHGIALGGRWAELVAPFVIDNATQFRVPPPPTLSSAEFALEFAEVLARGGDGNGTATMRDEWGTMVGLFWAYDGTGNVCAPPRLYMQLALEAATQNQLPMVDVVRMAATIAIAMADAGLASWESKYYYRRGRPVTCIRSDAAADNNAATNNVAGWHPLGAPASNSQSPNFTPPFPAYPSGHATFGSAMLQILRTYIGRDRFTTVFTSSEFDGVTRDNNGRVRPRITRTFDSATQMQLENQDSRIQLGIHWRRDCTAGSHQGIEVANAVQQRIYRSLTQSA